MEIYLLKTQYNTYSSQLESMVQMFNFGETVIDEAFSSEGEEIRSAGVRAVPSLVALTRDENNAIVLLHQTSAAQDLPTFMSVAQANFDELGA